MRIVFHNPHTLIWYKTPFYHFINELKSVDKYDYLFDGCYGDESQPLYVYLDDASLAPPLTGALRRFSTPLIEFYVWVLMNGLKPSRFKVIRDLASLTGDDVLITFVYEHFTNLTGDFDIPRDRLIDRFKNTRALKVVHLSHYGYHASLASRNCQAAGVDLFVAENNLAKHSSFFRQHFPWYRREVHLLPLVPKKRFVKTVPFRDRKNRAMAMGTITLPMADRDFLDFFGHDRLQPMRQEIYHRAREFADVIDSFISPINAGTPDPGEAPTGLVRLFKRGGATVIKLLWPARVVYSLLENLATLVKILCAYFMPGRQGRVGNNERAYFKFDLVQRYNEYRMFLCPEEIIDLPAIGFVEGMACGCAFIGIRDPMYHQIGLIDKVNYIGYDGTLEDAADKIRYYQKHESELEEIAAAGCSHVHRHFNGPHVYQEFMDFLQGEVTARRRQ